MDNFSSPRFNAFPQRVKLKSSPLLAPSVCVRVVTRGIYPKLVKDTVKKNMDVLAKVGFENYLMQVVTDQSIQIEGTIESMVTVLNSLKMCFHFRVKSARA